MPTSSSNVCIKVAGTYTVSVVGSASAATVVVGGSSGTETLKIKGTPADNSNLALSSATGSSVGAHGVVKLKSKNVSGTGFAMISGGGGVTISNSGLFETSGGADNPNYLRVNVTNNSGGTVKINGSTTQDGSGGASTITNNGSFSVGSAGILNVSGSSGITQSGGTFANNGQINQSGGTFTQSGGTDSGVAVNLINGTLNDSAGSGTYTFDILGSDNLSGTDIPANQTVDVLGTTSYNSQATLSGNFTINGTLELDAENVAGAGYAIIYGPSDTVTNDGKFETENGTTASENYVRTSISNTSGGTVALDGKTTQDGSGGVTTLSNNGTFSIGSGDSLAVGGSSNFTQSGGTFTNSGTLTQDGGTFTQSGGTDSGNAVVILNASLADSAESGTFTFDMEASDNLSGTIPSGQTVDIIGSPSYNSEATIGANLTNDGTLELDALTTAGSGLAELYGPTHTVTNAGTIETEGGTVSSDYWRTNVTNNSGASIDIDGITADDGSGGVTTLTNNGTFSIGSGDSLTVSGSSLFDQAGGTFTNSGAFEQSGGTFTQAGGADSGNPAVILNGSLADSASTGTFTFELEDSDNLSGTIPSGQTVDVLGNPSYNSETALSANLTNNGTLELDSTAASGSGYAMLYGPTETVTNAGTFETEGGTVSPDYLRTNVTNNSGSTVNIDGITDEDGSGGVTTLTNKGTLTVGDGDTLTVSGGSAFTQASTGTFEPSVDASTGVWGIIGGVDTVAGTLTITTVGSPTSGSTYNVIGSASSVTGTFSSVTGPYTVTYTSTAVTAKHN